MRFLAIRKKWKWKTLPMGGTTFTVPLRVDEGIAIGAILRLWVGGS